MEPDNQPASPEEKVTISLSDFKALVAEAVKEAVQPFAEANAKLQEQVAQASHMAYADGIPAHLRRGDPTVDPSRMQVARSVTIATRPVMENPEQYQNVVDPGGLSINNASPLSPKNLAECFEDPNGTP